MMHIFQVRTVLCSWFCFVRFCDLSIKFVCVCIDEYSPDIYHGTQKPLGKPHGDHTALMPPSVYTACDLDRLGHYTISDHIWWWA